MELTIVRSRVPPPKETVYQIPLRVIETTLKHLQKYGDVDLEAVGYWIGPYKDCAATTDRLWVPRFKATVVSYDVEPAEMLRLKKDLDGSGYVLLAQVHSHPGDAFHSDRDDINAASPWLGFISVVVPDGGRISRPFFDAAEVFEHAGKCRWRHLDQEEKRSRFIVQ